MTVAEFVPLVWLKFKGKGADKAPTAGPKWANILALANAKLQEKWATDPKQNWSSLFRTDSYSIAASIELDADVAKAVDSIALIKDGVRSEPIPVVGAKDRNKYSICVYRAGINPKTLNFNVDIPTQFVGGKAEVAVNRKPESLVAAGNEIECDNTLWLVAEVAADLAFKKAHYGNLVNEANDEYEKMCEANTTSFGSGQYVQNGYGDFL